MSSSATDYILSGSVGRATRVSGGIDVLFDTASGTTISGGTEYVYAGGPDSGTLIGSGGYRDQCGGSSGGEQASGKESSRCLMGEHGSDCCTTISASEPTSTY